MPASQRLSDIRRMGVGYLVLLAICFLLASPLPADAATPAATITHATGTAHLSLPDGSLRLASVGTELPEGTVVSVEQASSVRIRFNDGTELVLKPGSRLRIEAFHYEPEEPESDRLAFSLIKGGLRAVTGLVGRRGDPDAFEGRTLVGSIGIRGTEFGMLLCEPGECDALLEGLPKELRDRIGSSGLFFEVTAGVISFANESGEVLFTIEQWGYADDMARPPIVVSSEPPDGVPFPLRRILPLIAATESIGGFSAGLGVDPFAQCLLQ